MKNKKIGIDIDEVLLSFVPGLNEFYNGIYGTNFRFEDYDFYNLEKIWGGTKERVTHIMNDFYNHIIFDNMPPIDGSQRAINFLSENNDLVAITSRPESIKIKTINWIGKYFGRDIKEVIFSRQYGINSSEVSKADICLEKNIEVMMEDKFEVAKECSEKKITTFLLDKPWNQRNSILNNNFFRVKDWGEILEILENLK